MTEMTASNPDNQERLERLIAEGRTPRCPDCGAPIFSNDECAACWGEDPYGQPQFCPVEEFCCGC